VRRQNGLLIAVAAVSTVLGGCQGYQPTRSTPVQSQDEAASFLVVPTMVVPWNQVSDAMQPNFALSGDQALLQVAPVTARVQEQVLNAFGATLGIGLPQTSTQSSSVSTGSQTTTTTTGGSTPGTTGTGTAGSTTSSTTTSAPGTAPTVSTGTPAGAQALTAASNSGDIGVDPVLKYQSALALFEAVQMLNREAQNAAVLADSVPFLVRLKFALMPYRQHLPYSMHSRISFFPNGCSSSGTTPEVRLAKPIEGKTRVEPDALCRKFTSRNQDLPVVVPLLAADDIERALRSSAVESARQIGLALSAMTHSVGANLGFNNLNQSIDAISDQDLNSRLTVTRQSENTLYVRIAASNETTSSASLVGQTYDVALLLLVPRDYFGDPAKATERYIPDVRIVTHTQFRNTNDGTVLPDRPHSVLTAQIDHVMQQALVGSFDTKLVAWSRLSDLEKESFGRCLASPVQQQDFQSFQVALGTRKGTDNSDGQACQTGQVGFSLEGMNSIFAQQNLWTALNAILADTAMKSSHFELHWPQDIVIPNQTALIADDAKDGAQVQLWGVTGASSATLAATLKVLGKDNKRATFAAQTLNLDLKAHVLTLGFASPTKWGFSDIDPMKTGDNALFISQIPCPHEALCPQLMDQDNLTAIGRSFPVLLAKASSDATPSFLLTAKITQLVADKGLGSVTISIDKLATGETATVTLDGADITSLTDGSGTVLPTSVSGNIVSSTATLVYQLRNLRVGATVTITAEGKKGGVSTGKRSQSFAVVSA
jgi:hypothetical protein